MNLGPIEQLKTTHPELEVWWDSSPLIFKKWVKKMVDHSAPEEKEEVEAQLSRLLNLEEPAKSVFTGCTTNPPLSLTAVQSDPDFWNEWIDQLILDNPDKTLKELFWLTYKEVLRRGSEIFKPVFEASGGKYGFVSAQLDPRLFTEVEVMVRDAEELRAINPNIMIKVPGSTQGIEVLKILASKAIPTNTTTCFSVPQIMASARATAEGIKLAQKAGVDISKWRAVITHMIGRLTENKELDIQAERRGIHLSWEEKHWWGIQTFRHAYRLLSDYGMPSKLLACSMRDGPLSGGRYRFWDLEKIAGGAIVYTCPPYVLEPLYEKCKGIIFYPEIEKDDIPPDVLWKISKIPYCIQASDENGMEVDQFNTHPATIDTVANFSKASAGLESYVGERMKIVTGSKGAI